MRWKRIQFSQIACSQQGRRKALTASLLQIAQRSLMGMSSWDRDLFTLAFYPLSSIIFVGAYSMSPI